jgi:hypothetical protein
MIDIMLCIISMRLEKDALAIIESTCFLFLDNILIIAEVNADKITPRSQKIINFLDDFKDIKGVVNFLEINIASYLNLLLSLLLTVLYQEAYVKKKKELKIIAQIVAILPVFFLTRNSGISQTGRSLTHFILSMFILYYIIWLLSILITPNERKEPKEQVVFEEIYEEISKNNTNSYAVKRKKSRLYIVYRRLKILVKSLKRRFTQIKH